LTTVLQCGTNQSNIPVGFVKCFLDFLCGGKLRSPCGRRKWFPVQWRIDPERVRFGFMMRKAINVSLSILLLLPLFSGEFVSSALAKSRSSSSEICSSDNGANSRFQKPCDMDHCNPLPKCPLCPSSSSMNPYLCQGAGVYLPPLPSSLIIINPDALPDQGFVSSIFRPPTSPLQHALPF
jgi:hypothetical protein